EILMMVSAFAVHVAMLNFFGGSFTHLHYFNCKVEFNTGEGMVAINGYTVLSHFGHRYDSAGIGVKAHAFFYFLTTKRRQRYLLHELRVLYTVSFFGFDFYIKFITSRFSFQAFFHSGYQVSNTLDVVQRITPFT